MGKVEKKILTHITKELLSNGEESKLVHDLINYCNDPVSRNTWMRWFIYSSVLDVALCNGDKECPHCGKIHKTDLFWS